MRAHRHVWRVLRWFAARLITTCASAWQCGGVKSAAARTSEVQRGEGRVLLERGGQRRSPIITDAVACNTQGGHGHRRVQAHAARAQVIRGTPNHHMCIGVAVWRGEKCRGTHPGGPAW